MTDMIARCRRGDEAAWVHLYQSHQGRVARFLRYFLGPIRDVEDLVQQVFVETVRSMGRFRGESSLSTWLFSITRHVAEMHLRTEFRRDRRCQAYADWSDLTGQAAQDPAMYAERLEMLRTVADTLEGMDTRHRMVWLMVEVEGLTSFEAAGKLEIPPGTIRSRMHHARGEVLGALEAAGFSRGRKKQTGCVVTSIDRAKGPVQGGIGPGKGRI